MADLFSIPNWTFQQNMLWRPGLPLFYKFYRNEKNSFNNRRFGRNWKSNRNLSGTKRLQCLEQAHYLISKKKQRPSDVYLEVVFENLSHFSFAFKKLFGLTPTGLAEREGDRGD